MVGNNRNKTEFLRKRRTLNSMLSVDFRRMFTTPLFYIMLGIAVVMPVLILVMTTMMDGSASVDPSTGVETAIEGFDSVWQIIGTASGETSSAAMSITSMCNINLVYFMAAVLACLFVSADFKSGYAKNLFAVRPNKMDYIISKTVVCVFAGIWMLLGFFAGAMLGRAVAGLPFALETASMFGVILCMLAKIFLLLVFVPIFVLMSTVAKDRTWLSLLLSLFGGMLLYMMVPMMTPLNSTLLHVVMCMAGGALFFAGFTIASSTVLRKTDLV